MRSKKSIKDVNEMANKKSVGAIKTPTQRTTTTIKKGDCCLNDNTETKSSQRELRVFSAGVVCGVLAVATLMKMAEREFTTVGGEIFLIPLGIFFMLLGNKLLEIFFGKE